MTKYKTSGTASINLRAEFKDEGSELYDQAMLALNTEHLTVILQSALTLKTARYDLIIDEFEELTLGEIIKQKAARARAWVLGE